MTTQAVHQLDSYRFGPYELRPTTREDLPLAYEWTHADEHHRFTIPGDYWVSELPGINCYLLCDQIGPVFFVRLQLTRDPYAIRIFLQFAPHSRTNRYRNMEALTVGLAWLETHLVSAGYARLIFSSRSPMLTRYCVKRLGFVLAGTNLTKHLGGNDGKEHGNLSAAGPPHEQAAQDQNRGQNADHEARQQGSAPRLHAA